MVTILCRCINTESGIKISKELFNQYCDDLVNKCFKILPLYEGKKSKHDTNRIPENIAYENYKSYIKGFIVEISGAYYIFEDKVEFIEILSMLRGMMIIEKGNHRQVKSSMFHTIRLIEGLKEEE